MTLARSRLLPAGVLALVSLLVTSCAGPQRSLSIGVQQYGTDVQFGSDAVQAAPPVAPGGMTLAPPPVGGQFLSPVPTPAAVASAAPSLPPIPVACPSADPFAVVALAARSSIPAPPRAATYHYRNDGLYQTSGATPVSQPYPTESTRVVGNIATTPTGGFTFDVVNTLGGLVATTGYEYVPASVPQVNASTPTAGLYVTRIHQTNGSTTVSDFTAAGAGLLILQVPVVPGTAWTTTATDATTGATIQAGVTEVGHQRVNACGAALDSVAVHIDGTIQVQQNVANQHIGIGSPGPTPSGATNVQPMHSTSTTFVADYAIAPQYGGLSVMDTVDETGTQAGVTVNSKNTSTIASVPVAP